MHDEQTISLPRARPNPPSEQSVILGTITRLTPLQATVAISVVDGLALPAGEEFQGIIRVQDVRATEKDKVKIGESFRGGDVVRGVVVRASLLVFPWLCFAIWVSAICCSHTSSNREYGPNRYDAEKLTSPPPSPSARHTRFLPAPSILMLYPAQIRMHCDLPDSLPASSCLLMRLFLSPAARPCCVISKHVLQTLSTN